MVQPVWSRDLRYSNPTNVSIGQQDTSLALYGLLGTAGMVMGAYHGYKRNNSVGWAIGWGLLGGLFPFITIPVSLAQGFGKRAK